MKTIATEESIYALWKGNVPASAMYVIYGATQFTSYSVLNTWVSQLEKEYGIKIGPGSHSFLLGSTAGCVSTTLSYPFDLLRTRFANSVDFLSITSTVRSIIQEEGYLGFFKGCNTAVVSISLYTGLLFWSYESARIITAKFESYSTYLEPICGFGAGLFAKAVVFPLDLVRKRIQVDTVGHSTFLKTFIGVVQKEGPRALYKGFFASIIKSAPTSAISLWTYEYVMRLMD
jgi:solute carrier family 25 thiamine pyrophosphate transporter 19